MNLQRYVLTATVAILIHQSTFAVDRRIEKEVTVDAPRAEVWQAWTTTEGVNSFLGIQSKIECKPGGMYEYYFAPNAPEGQRGAEGCKVLFTDAPELLAFSWNAPPKIEKLRSAGVRTQVFVRLTEVSPKQTKVKLTHLITEQGPDWDQYMAYFENAWPRVLEALQKYFTNPTRKSLPLPAPGVAPLVQTFDLDFPAEKVWRAFVDVDVAKQWITPKYLLELKVGGEMKGSYNADAFPGDDSWIVRDVLGFDPGRILAYHMKKAPNQFAYKKAIEDTWTVMYFDSLPDNKCRFRLAINGLRDDEETRRLRDHFIKNNPKAIDKLKSVLAKTP